MKIDLTREQYRNLLGYLVIANSVLGPLGDFAEGLEEEAEVAQKLEDYIAQYAPLFDSEDMVHNHSGLLHVDDAVSEKVHYEIIDEYDEWSFWDELEKRLTNRDIDRDLTLEEKEKIVGDVHAWIELTEKYYEKYRKEFEENGIDRMHFSDAPQED